MIHIVINNHQFAIENNPQELTVAKAMAIEELMAELPEDVKKHLFNRIDAANNTIGSIKGNDDKLGVFNKSLLAILGGIPEELCKKTDPSQIEEFLECYLPETLRILTGNTREQSWRELSYIAGGFRPAEVIAARGMICSDLLAMMSAKATMGTPQPHTHRETLP